MLPWRSMAPWRVHIVVISRQALLCYACQVLLCCRAVDGMQAHIPFRQNCLMPATIQVEEQRLTVVWVLSRVVAQWGVGNRILKPNVTCRAEELPRRRCGMWRYQEPSAHNISAITNHHIVSCICVIAYLTGNLVQPELAMMQPLQARQQM